MGFFSTIKENLYKAKAATIVETLLEQQANMGCFNRNPADAANQMIQSVWDSSPETFNGKRGQQPHKATLAATALGCATVDIHPSDPDRAGVIIAFSLLMREITENKLLYPFNALDDALLEEASEALDELTREIEQQMETSGLAKELDAIVGE